MRKRNVRELRPIPQRKKVKFPGGNKNVIKEINVYYDNDSELVEIPFDVIKSKITKHNLLILQEIYKIKWEKITRYPVNTRYGYIVEGKLSTDKPITFVRKELNHKGSGKTDLWFDNGYVLPAPKVIRVHERFNEKIEFWGPSIKEETILKWVELTSNEQVLLSYKLSRFVYSSFEKRDQPWKYPDEIIKWIVSTAKKINREDYLRLLTELQKIQFERT